MTEKVHTGGTAEFRYGKDKRFVLEKEREQAIKEAYERARIRKAKERKRNIIIAVIIILLVLGLISYLLIK